MATTLRTSFSAAASEFSTLEELQQRIGFIKSVLHGDIREVRKASLSRINKGIVLPVQIEEKILPIHLTPIFVAAIAGNSKIVKTLLNMGASTKCKFGEDLFTWTCLCPNSEKRKAVLEHVDAPEEYKIILKDVVNFNHPVIAALRKSLGHPLSPFNVSVLANIVLPPDDHNDEAPFIRSSQFREMSSIELATYRVAIYRLLDIEVEKYKPNRFIVALQLGDLEVVKEEVKKAVSKEEISIKEFLSREVNDLGLTPSMIVCGYGHLQLLEYLIEHKVDLSAPLSSGNSAGWTPASIAARFGHAQVLNSLVEWGIDPSIPMASGNSAGWTPASIAARFGQAKVLSSLAEWKVDLSAPLVSDTLEGWTLASIAARFGQVEALKSLAEWKIDLSAPLVSGSLKGWTPATIAARVGHADALQALAMQGVDLSTSLTSDSLEGWTPAGLAAWFGQTKVLQSLHMLEVDLSAPLSSGILEGWTPAGLAARLGQEQVLESLAELEINLSAPLVSGKYEGYTPAAIAAQFGKVGILKLLAELEIDLSAPLTFGDANGWTPATIAARLGEVRVLKFLATRQLNLSTPPVSEYGNELTPSCIAACFGQIKVLKYLEQCGVDLFSPMLTSGRLQGRTLASIAVAMGQTEVVKFFAKRGVDFSAPLVSGTYQGWTPASLAAGLNQVKVLEFLKKSCGIDLSLIPIDTIFSHDSNVDTKVELIHFLIQNGYNRFLLLQKVHELSSHGRYLDFLSEKEKLLDGFLQKEYEFLEKILTGKITFSVHSCMRWSQGQSTRLYNGNEVPNLLFFAITSLLSKDVDKSVVPHTIRNALEKLEKQPEVSKRTSRRKPITTEQSHLLCTICQQVEDYSTELTRSQMQSAFPLEPIHISWIRNQQII